MNPPAAALTTKDHARPGSGATNAFRTQLRVLLVENSEDDAGLLLRNLRRGGYEPIYRRVDTRDAMEAALREQEWEIVIADYSVPAFGGLAAISLVRAMGLDLPVIIVSDAIGEELAVEAMKAGADDYVTKGNLSRLIPAIQRELSARETRRQRVEEVAEQATRRLAELDATIASIADAVLILDPEGKISRMNPAAEAILGFGSSGQTRPYAEMMAELRFETPDGKPLSHDEMPGNRALKGETTAGELLVIRWQDGKTIWVAASAAPIKTKSGRTQGAVVTFTDVTALRQLQEQQEDIVRAISHDLRSPLTVVVGHAQILWQALSSGKADSRRRRSADAIILAARQMNAMIRDLVDSARMEAGELELNKSAVEIPALVQDIKERMAEVLDMERVKVEADPRIPPVLADPDRLERILINLLTNALKYSDPDTEVTVAISLQGEKVVTSVSDHGEGIPAEEFSHLFQRYGRTRHSRRRQDSQGLGLYITRGLVEAHGGRIWVESEVKRGSTFYFSLPAADGGSAKSSPGQPL